MCKAWKGLGQVTFAHVHSHVLQDATIDAVWPDIEQAQHMVPTTSVDAFD